jgi:hypothetical protein
MTAEGQNHETATDSYCKITGCVSMVEAIKKLLSGLYNVLQKPREAFKGFGTRFTQLHAKVMMQKHCLILSSMEYKTKHKVKKALVQKAMRVHSAVSGGRLMQ